MDSPRFSQFDISVVTYKTVRNHEIQAYILIPKNIPSGKHPLIVQIHGGGSVCGSGIYPDWFPQYLLTLALRTPSILISPNYRLLPESSAPEMISDITSFWTWLRTPSSTFHTSLPSHITPNLSHTLLYGNSAGGHLAILSALTEPEHTIQACIAAYPQLDLESPWFTEKFEKHPFGVAELPVEILDQHLEALHPDPSKRVLVSDTPDPHDRLKIILVTMQQGRYREMFGDEEGVYPFRVLERIARERGEQEEGKGKQGRKMPFLWLYHGERDSVLPVEGSTKFARRWREVFGEQGLKVHVEGGEHSEHGFDGLTDVDVQWVREGLEVVEEAWLG